MSAGSTALARAATWFRGFAGPWKARDLGLLLVVCPLFFATGAGVSERLRHAGHVMPGVELDGTSVAGWAPPVLMHQLSQREAELRARSFYIGVGDAELRFTGAELGFHLQQQQAVERAMAAGRSGGWLDQLRWRVARFQSTDPVESEVALPDAVLDELWARLEERYLRIPREAGLSHDGKALLRVEPRPGQLIDRPAAVAALREALRSGQEPRLVLPLSSLAPSTNREQLDAAQALAEKLLSAPLTMQLQLPEPAPDSPDAPAEEAAAPEVTVQPKRLRAAIATAVVDGELRLVLEPNALDELLRPIRERFERPAQDAVFQVSHQGRISIEPSRIQTHLPTETAAEQLLLAAERPDRRGLWKVVPGEQPRITTALARQLNIKGLVAQFTTQHPCCRPRVKNIHRMADLVDGVVVLPGETFSINELIGPRSKAKGFVPAPTIVHGEMDDTVGGGVSQFATTIYNAVFDAGYEIIERQAHSYYFSRYPVGHEATLSFPKPDFIFKNDTKSGVLLKTEYGNTWIRVKVYGDNEGRKVKREVSERFDFTEPPLLYEVDDELLPDEAVVKKRGERGFSVNVSRLLTFADGETKTERRKVVYNAQERIIRVHSCMIPEGEEGYTGEDCPEPEELDAGAPSEEELP